MRWPIRNQILLPFLLIQTVMVVAIAIVSAWTSVRQVEQEIERRLNNVLTTLETGTYPLTSRILDQLTSLSDASFVICRPDGTLLTSNLGHVGPLQLKSLRGQFEHSDRDLIDDRSVVTIGDHRYFCGSVRRSRAEENMIFVLLPESRWVQARSRAMVPPLMIGGICLFLTVLASIWIARRASRRVQTVQQHVSRIAAGDFTAAPTARTDDELRDLTLGVNQMAEVLDGLIRSVRENERSAMLTQLVGGLAHQLRNSLTGARTSVQLHQRQCGSEDRESLDVAIRQLTLTEEQIKALLRLAKGDSQPRIAAPLTLVLDETAALVRPICTHHRIDFSYHRDDSPIQVDDADAMRGAMLNIVMNAIEAAGPGGEIRVSLVHRSAAMVIEIQDSGPGVSSAVSEDIFTPFFTTKPEGAGLGLALARHAAEDCGGSLEYYRREGWSVFRMIVPDRDGSALYSAASSSPQPTESHQVNNS